MSHDAVFTPFLFLLLSSSLYCQPAGAGRHIRPSGRIVRQRLLASGGASFPTGSNASVSSPPLHLSSAFRYASLQSATLKSSVNWSNTVAVYAPNVTAVMDQGACASSWAFSSVASVSYGAAIGGNTTSLLSVQQVLDCTGGDNTCSMGWPYAALDYMVNASLTPATAGLEGEEAYPYTATQGTCAATSMHSSHVAVSAFERVGNGDWFNLLLALQSQPVVAFLYASHVSFLSYAVLRGAEADVYNDATCGAGFTVDHSLLVIGYSLAGPNPYWLLRNSWGEGWGIMGNMLMAITGGMGICNIHMVPPIYPVISFPNPCTLNPCGAGTCIRNFLSHSSYVCYCPPGYTAVPLSPSQQTCNPTDVCATSPVLPCGIGTCKRVVGGYTCMCPPGFVSGSRADGSAMCIPSLLTTSVCAVYYPLAPGDTCRLLSSLFNISIADLIALNSGLACTVTQLLSGFLRLLDLDIYQPGKQLCIQSGSLTALPSCTSWFVPRGTDSCASIRSSYGLSPSDLYSLNPGLQCTNLYPSLVVQGGVATPRIGAPVCVSNINPFNTQQGGLGRLLFSASSCKSGNYMYSVQRGDYCSRIISKYCFGSYSAFQRANNGWACTNNALYVGQRLCVLMRP